MPKREFNWDFKENMTQEDFNAVLEQHVAFLGADKLNARVEELETEVTDLNTKLTTANEQLAPVKEKEKADKLLGLMPKNADTTKIDDIIKLSNLTDEMDDEAIKEAFASTLESREYLKVSVSTVTPKTQTIGSEIFEGEPAKPETPDKSEIFD